MTGTRLVALLAALVIGVGGGVTTALVADEPGPVEYADPLGLDAPLVNLPDCTGEAVLVVAVGLTAPPLSSALANLPADEREQVRYLQTSRSCDARWTAEDATLEPAWVAYLGPGNKQDLCVDRMTADHRGDNVTFLKDGSEVRAECLCEVPIDDAPVLSRDMETDDATTIWVKALQSILVTIDEDRERKVPTALTDADITGVYDERTIARVDTILAGGFRPTTGVVDKNVWRQLTRTGCGLYDYS